MKSASFSYRPAGSLDEALDLLRQHGDEAKVLAGGQSLVPLMSMRLARPSVLVDIGRVEGLNAIERTNGHVSIGAMARERAAERSELIGEHVPLLAAAMPLIGHLAIRNRGTVGGSIAHADPAAEIPAVAVAVDAEMIVTSALRGQRRIAASDFFEGFWTSALLEDEILTEIRFPVAPTGTGVAFEEAARRHGDYAMVGAAASMRTDAGRIEDARVVLIGVASTPLRRPEAEQVLIGAPPGADVIDAAVAAAVEGLTPASDVHGSSTYRRHLAGVLAGRAIRAALANAEEKA